MLLPFTWVRVTFSEHASTESCCALTQNLSLEVQPGQSLPVPILLASSLSSCPLHQCSFDTDMSQPWSQNGRKQIPSVEGWVLADSQQCCRSPSVSEEEEGWEWRLSAAEGERDCLFSCTELFDRLRYNVKPHLKSQCATSESGWVSVWDGLLAATSWAVTWPSAMALFYCHAINAIAFFFKAGFTCSLKGCVPIMGWVPLSEE